MFQDIRQPYKYPEAKHYKVIDLDTGEDIPRVIWADDVTGQYEQVVADESGRIFLDDEGDGVLTRKCTGRIKLVKVS